MSAWFCSLDTSKARPLYTFQSSMLARDVSAFLPHFLKSNSLGSILPIYKMITSVAMSLSLTLLKILKNGYSTPTRKATLKSSCVCVSSEPYSEWARYILSLQIQRGHRRMSAVLSAQKNLIQARSTLPTCKETIEIDSCLCISSEPSSSSK